MSRKLLLIKEENIVWSAVFEDGRLFSVNGARLSGEAGGENGSDTPRIGDIYIGKVGNIVKNINSAFVDIKNGLCPVYLDLTSAENMNFGMGPLFTRKSGVKIHRDDELIVQIVKDAVKTKRAVASCEIQIPGHYLILVHGKSQVSISSKIKNKKRRQELKEVLEDLATGTYSFIVRTNAESAGRQDIIDEGMSLIKRYDDILKRAGYERFGTRLYREPEPYLCEIRNQNQQMLDEILIEDEDLYKEVKGYMEDFLPSSLKKLTKYQDDLISMNSLYGFDNKLSQALNKKVWLKSGAYLVIEPTEAMTIIDVNTGKAINGKKSKEETILRINLEAAKEIACQLCLRNLSGIIIIDFIDMDNRENQDILLKELEKLLEMDPVRTCLIDITPLNLVEITRKKIKKPLHELVSELRGRNKKKEQLKE